MGARNPLPPPLILPFRSSSSRFPSQFPIHPLTTIANVRQTSNQRKRKQEKDQKEEEWKAQMFALYFSSVLPIWNIFSAFLLVYHRGKTVFFALDAGGVEYLGKTTRASKGIKGNVKIGRKRVCKMWN
jgi:hypothetical protein